MSTNKEDRTDDTPIEDADVSVRCVNGCYAAGLRTIGEVRAYGPRRLLGIKGFGRTSYRELRRMLEEVPEGVRANNGGPAFPCEGGDSSGLHPHPGMTLRDWFAGQALAGIIVATQISEGFATTEDFGGDHGPENQYSTIGRDAYAIADAMLAARNGNGGAA